MNEDKMYEMLMSIMQDLAVVKSKLDTLEEIKIDAKTSNAKIERLEKFLDGAQKFMEQNIKNFRIQKGRFWWQMFLPVSCLSQWM